MINSQHNEVDANERLKDIFQRLMELYERHAQEREGMIKEKEEINRLVHLLVTQTKEIGQYENIIRKGIQDTIKESAYAAMNNIEKLRVEKTDRSNENISNKIMQIFTSLESIVSAHHAEKNKFWQMFTAAILSGILSSVLMTWLLMPKPILPLTNTQISYLQNGQVLAQVWPKLIRQEKDRLKSLFFN